jgi:biopolymer transport protein ExbD
VKIGIRNRRDDDLDINVTSFIDILLLLLIFFMLATSFVSEGRMNIRLPNASTQPDDASSSPPIQITVTAQGSYLVNDQALINNSAEGLMLAMNKVAGKSREQAVLVRADAASSHQAVVTVMDVVGRLGFRSINISTLNQADAGSVHPK